MANSEHKVIINAQDNASSTIKKVEGNFIGLWSVISRAVAAVWAFEVAKWMVRLWSQAEQAAISFETLLKSGTKATAMLKDIEDFAAKTPFEKAGLTEGVQKLMGMGIAAERALPTMQVLGDAIGAVWRGQEDLDGVVLALGQIQAKGKLSMEETLQIAERGLPIFDILRTQLGLTQEQIGNLGKEGIKSSVAIDAILTGLNERFAGAMEKQSKTLAGQWSTAMDNVKNSATSIIGPVNTALTAWLAAANAFFSENEKSIKESGGRIVDTFLDLLDAGAATFGGIAWSAWIAFDAITDKQAESGTDWMANFRIVMQVLSKSLAIIAITVNTGIQAVFGAAAQAINSLRTVGRIAWEAIATFADWVVDTVVDAIKYIAKPINQMADTFGLKFRIVTDGLSSGSKAARGFGEAWSAGMSDMEATNKSFSENLGKSNAAIYDKLFKSMDDYDAKLKKSNDTAAKGPTIMERNAEAIKKIKASLEAGKSDMYASGGSDKKKSGKSEAEKAADELKKTKESASAIFGQLDSELATHNERVVTLTKGYLEMKDRIGEMVVSGKAQVTALNDEFKRMGERFSEEIGKMKSDLESLDKDFGKQSASWLQDLATRAAEIQNQISDAKSELSRGNPDARKEYELQTRIRNLEKEYELARTKVSEDDVKKAQERMDKGETEKIIERMEAEKKAYEEKRLAIEEDIKKKTKDHEDEMARFKEAGLAKKAQLEDEIRDYQRKLVEKRSEIQKEVATYADVVKQKQALDDAYFENFNTKLKAQKTELESVLSKMSKAGIAGSSATKTEWVQARADGWRVMPWSAYVVGENRPELFIPDRPGTIVPQTGGGGISVTVNMGGVSVSNWMDVRKIADMVAETLTRKLQLQAQGISA